MNLIDKLKLDLNEKVKDVVTPIKFEKLKEEQKKILQQKLNNTWRDVTKQLISEYTVNLETNISPEIFEILSQVPSTGYPQRAYEEVLKCAALRNCEVVHPKNNQLFIDIDNMESLKIFCENVINIRRLIVESHIWESPSKSPGRYHILVKLNQNKTEEQRVMLQLYLGSDPVREKLSLDRLMKNLGYPSLFFETIENMQDSEFVKRFQ